MKGLKGFQKGHSYGKRFEKGHRPWSKGMVGKFSLETLTKMSKAKLGYVPWIKGKKNPKAVYNPQVFKKGMTPWNKGIKVPQITGEKHPLWKGGIQYRPFVHLTGNFEYKQWRTAVFKRDEFKCKIGKDICSRKLQAHHILNWIDYPELRYDVNNGITLCHAHHPRGRANEKRMVSTFMELLSVSKVPN